MRVDSHISTARNHSVEHTTHNLHVRSIKNEDVRDFPFIPKPDYDTPPEKVRLSEHLSPKPDLTLHLGKKIGRGGKGDVYENKFNPREVIKLFKESPSQKDVEHEVNCFCKCHGEGSASTIVSNGIVIGIKMRKIKGTPLNRLPSIPNKAKFKFESMIEEMISSFERISSQIGEDIFMCPSDYPYLYMNNEMTNILIGNKRHWRTIKQTLCTFLTSKKLLNKHWHQFEKTCEDRHDPFEKYLNEIYEKEICVSPLKSLSLHVTNINSSYGLAPFIDYKKLWDENDI